MSETRAARRERIAGQLLAGMLACSDIDGDATHFAGVVVKLANVLMAELDKAAAEESQQIDPVRQLAELQNLQEAKDAAVERSIKKSILIWQRDREIDDLNEQVAILKAQLEAKP